MFFFLWSEKAPAVVSALPKLVSIKATGLNGKMDPSDTEEDAAEDEVSTTLPTQDSPTLPKTPSAVSQAPPAAGEEDFRRSYNGFPVCPTVMVWYTTQEGHLMSAQFQNTFILFA